MILQPGGQEKLIQETTLGAGTTVLEGSVKTDAVLITLYVSSVSPGSALDVRVVTLTDTDREVDILNFPQIDDSSSPILLLKKSGVIMQRFRVYVTYTGILDYEIYARAIESAGESSVKILGSNSFQTDSVLINETPSVLVPSALQDRNGVSILNYGGTGILYVSEDSSKLPDRAWPVPAGGGWSLDVASGVTIYAVSDDGDLDVRIVQAGG